MPRVRNGLCRQQTKRRTGSSQHGASDYTRTSGRAVARRVGAWQDCVFKSGTDVDKPFECTTIGTLIVVRFCAAPTEQTLEACQDAVLALSRRNGLTGVIYDLRQMGIPSFAVMLHQRTIDLRTEPTSLTRRIVVPNLFIGHLARMAFSAGSCTIFYDDFEAAKLMMLGAAVGLSWTMSDDVRMGYRSVTN